MGPEVTWVFPIGVPVPVPTTHSVETSSVTLWVGQDGFWFRLRYRLRYRLRRLL